MLISLIELFVEFFSEYFSTFFTGQNHFVLSLELMVLRFFVALWAVEPLFAARSSDGNLSVHNVFAHIFYLLGDKLLIIYSNSNIG